ncbi:DUF7344 domain-containing protein [Halobellus inordinatus]|uniref:DUF7344 domain-containing protein n=1 Tax=Halobellus inordinatus TaxID=1126236 RepID=UPI002113EE20|nr:hypothetical protein [Halobellus ramosii]
MEDQHSRQTVQTNELLTICASQHCRPLLSYFRNSSSDTAALSNVIDEIAQQAHGGRHEVSIQLHHSLFPQLAEIGYLDYDKSSDVVRYHGHPELEAIAVAIANR